jgi:hypothetical protein
MSKIELETHEEFCPKCGFTIKDFGPKKSKQYRCLEDPKHHATYENVKTVRGVVFE